MTETVPVQTQQLFSAISESVSRSYASIPQVQAIYSRASDDGLAFWIFSTEQSYSDELMDRLLSPENTVLQKYEGVDIAFRYIPSVMSPRHEDVVGQGAQKIFHS